MNLVSKIRANWIWWCVFFLGIVLRFAFLTQYPLGVNQDEAFAGYEAYSLAKAGVDAHGYVNPVYFTAWGSGMNALYSYLSMPIIAIAGLSLFSVRFTQAMIGCIVLIIFYLLLRELFEKKYALWGFFLLAINPWHIMLSRWGLESNLAPEMIVIAVYFLIKAYKGKTICYIPSFFFWGLALYAYAIMWAFVPLVLVFFFVYGLRQRLVRLSPCLAIGIMILFILGIPLLLFVAVNYGWIPEIRTAFFSVPRLVTFRDGEISFQLMWYKLGVMLKLLITQKSKYDTFNNTNVGIYYYLSIPFIAIGIACSVRSFIHNWKEKLFDAKDMMLLWFMAAFLVGCVVSFGNINKLNCIHIPMIYFSVTGCVWLFEKKCSLVYPLTVAYLLFFGVFAKEYFVKIPSFKYYNYESALEYAQEHTDGDIGTILIAPPCVLMQTKMLPEDYMDTVDTLNFETVSRMGRYLFYQLPEELDPEILYVVGEIYLDSYLQDGYEILFENGNYYVVGYAQSFVDKGE